MTLSLVWSCLKVWESVEQLPLVAKGVVLLRGRRSGGDLDQRFLHVVSGTPWGRGHRHEAIDRPDSKGGWKHVQIDVSFLEGTWLSSSCT
jgi:hypothetical protein